MNKSIATVKIEIQSDECDFDDVMITFGKRKVDVCLDGLEEFFEPFNAGFNIDETYHASVYDRPSPFRFWLEFIAPVHRYPSFRIVDDRGKRYKWMDEELFDKLIRKLFHQQEKGKKFYIGLEEEQ